MEIQKYMEQNKQLYMFALAYIEENEDEDASYQSFNDLIKQFELLKISENKDELILFFHIISKISNNHHKNTDFIPKITKLLLFLSDIITKTFSNLEIFNIFKSNKAILYFLQTNKILTIDESISKLILNLSYMKSYKYGTYRHFFFPEIEKFIPTNKRKIIEKELFKYDSNAFIDFDKKRLEGENETKICTIIREDIIDDFISYINETNCSLSNLISKSIFETNSYLLNQKQITFIEYATFHGSIKILQYLKMKEIEFKSSLWLYSIHSKNPEIISFLKENKVEYPNNSLLTCLEEAIKCHHNEIAYYFLEDLNNSNNEDVIKNSFHYMNFQILPTEINDFFFLYACMFNYITFFKLWMNSSLKKDSSLLNKALINSASKNNNQIVEHLLSIPEIKIDKYFFQNMTKLKNLKIPSNIEQIEEFSFAKCTSLLNITIPNSVTKIGKGSFDTCINLEKIIIPSSVTSIGSSAFSECLSLKEIKILSSKIKKIENFTFIGCESLQEIVIPSSLTSIGAYSFVGCKSLKNIIIPPSVTSIGRNAFCGCSSLTEIEIPSKITSILSSTFCNCTSLKQISLPDSIFSIGSCAFNNCFSLLKINIPSLVGSIGESAFRNCISLIQITLPNSVKIIQDRAFEGCYSLEELNTSSSKIKIGKFVFEGCEKLKNKPY